MKITINNEDEYGTYMLKANHLLTIEPDITSELGMELLEILLAIREFEDKNFLISCKIKVKFYHKLQRAGESKELFHKRLLSFAYHHSLFEFIPNTYHEICNLIIEINFVELFDSHLPSDTVNFNNSVIELDSTLLKHIEKLDDGSPGDLY